MDRHKVVLTRWNCYHRLGYRLDSVSDFGNLLYWWEGIIICLKSKLKLDLQSSRNRTYPTMSMRDHSGDEGQIQDVEARLLDNLVLSEPRSYSTFTGAEKQDTGYATGTKNRCVFWIWKLEWTWNPGTEPDWCRKETAQANWKGEGLSTRRADQVRKWLEGEVQSLIANIGTLMGLDKNLVLVD